jgi:hypothetical protein
MPAYLTILTAFAAAIAPVFGAPAALALHPKIKVPQAAAKDVVEDSYIVVYNKDITPESTASHEGFLASVITKRDNAASVGAKYKIHEFAGYQISADVATINEIASSPEVFPASSSIF